MSMTWQDFPFPGVDPKDVTDDLILDVTRTVRDQLLTACDWTQLPDAPVDGAAWATYRQALRDLPASAPPRSIVFPDAPAS